MLLIEEPGLLVAPGATAHPTPFDQDPPQGWPAVGGENLWLLEPKTPAEFSAYLAAYDFGPFPPDFIVLHQTGNPCTIRTWLDAARVFGPRNLQVWDAGEAGISPAAVREQRRR